MTRESVWQTGGIKIGAWFMTWPAATLSISREGLGLKIYVLWRYKIPRASVESLRIEKGLLWWGLKVGHSHANAPTGFVFWSLDIESLKRALEAHGYEVEPAT